MLSSVKQVEESRNTRMCYTVNELANFLPLGRNSLYKLVNMPDFPKIVVGRKILIPIKGLEVWLEQNHFGDISKGEG
jgi:hypothetical protein